MQNGCSSLINTTKKGCKAFSSRSKWAPSNQTKSIVVLCHDDKCPLRVPRSPNQIVELKGANYHTKLSEAVRFPPENYHSLVFPEENKAAWLTAPITQITGFHWSVICWWVRAAWSRARPPINRKQSADLKYSWIHHRSIIFKRHLPHWSRYKKHFQFAKTRHTQSIP